MLKFQSHERYDSAPFHVSAGCQEGRLAAPLVMGRLLPFCELSCQGYINGRMKGSGQQFIVLVLKLIRGKDTNPFDQDRESHWLIILFPTVMREQQLQKQKNER